MNMKKMVAAISIVVSQPAFAVDLNGTTGYFGEIGFIAPGFYTHVGVGLQPGVTCNGLPYVLLKRVNALFKEIYAALLATAAAGKSIHFGPVIGNVIDSSSGLCVISEASTERVPAVWSSQ
jgi:hypothetical protein